MLILIHVVFAIHLTQWLITGLTVSPVEPSESMYTLRDGIVNAGFVFFVLAIVSTLIFGRFFCGWICPLGTLQHFVGNMHSESKRGKQRIESNRYKRWQTIKYVVLIVGLVAAANELKNHGLTMG